MQITPDHTFADAMASGANIAQTAQRLYQQRLLDDATIAESGARTKQLGVQTQAQQADLDQKTAERGLQGQIAGRMQAGNTVDPSTPTGISAPSQQMLEQGGTAYGAGGTAVNNAVGDNYREANRMGMTPQGPASANVVPYGQVQQTGDVASLAALKGDPAAMAIANHAAASAKAGAQYQAMMADIAQNPDHGHSLVDGLIAAHPELGITRGVDARGTPVLHVPNPTDPKGPPSVVPISPSVIGFMASAKAKADNGLMDDSLQDLHSADTAIGAHATAHVATLKAGIDSEQGAKTLENTHDYDMGQLAIGHERNSIESQRLLLEGLHGGTMVQDATGHTAIMIPQRGPGGNVTMTPVKLPDGYVPTRQEDPAQIENMVNMMRGDKANAGLPYEQLYAKARAIVSGGQQPDALSMVPPPQRGGQAGQPPAGGLAPKRIPDPPPQTLNDPSSPYPRAIPNPAFADWQSKFGDAYAQQNAAAATTRQPPTGFGSVENR